LNYKWYNQEEGNQMLLDPSFHFKIDCNHFNSFLFEFIVQVMLMLTYGHISTATKKVMKLTKPDKKWQEDIEWYWNRVEEIKAKAEAPDSEEDDGPLTIGTKTVLNKDERALEEQRKGEIELRFKSIQRELPVNFIDSHHFYSWNATFFVLSIILELFQAMVNNSASDIPSLFFILILFATYMFRK
jgi:hypothetical protein